MTKLELEKKLKSYEYLIETQRNTIKSLSEEKEILNKNLINKEINLTTQNEILIKVAELMYEDEYEDITFKLSLTQEEINGIMKLLDKLDEDTPYSNITLYKEVK